MQLTSGIGFTRMGIACWWNDYPPRGDGGGTRPRRWVGLPGANGPGANCALYWSKYAPEVAMATQVTPKPISIADFVTELHKFSEPAFEHTGEILEFLHGVTVAPETLSRYLSWDRQHYTRNLIDKTPLYELIAICWE